MVSASCGKIECRDRVMLVAVGSGDLSASAGVVPQSPLLEKLVMDKNDLIETLNDLIETSRDGEEGFRTCADAVKSALLKQTLEQAAGRFAQAVGELQAKVRSLGGDPARRSSVSGSLHRAWVDIKSTITGMDEAAILAECERGEDVAKKAYEDALSKDWPADLRATVERQYQGLIQHRDRVRQLRGAMS
jgi:uncharacterized protein (TIGR02284 family)